jgi:hypothetical protein
VGLGIMEEPRDRPLEGFDHFLSLRKITSFDPS